MLKMRDKLTNQLMMTAIIAQLLSTVLARGPHHPRGEKIAHHHVHYRPTRGISPESHVPVPKITQDKELIHDKEHIREDLGEWMEHKSLEDMSDDELEFHYFKLHDFDNNTKLDGLEILNAIQHTAHNSAGHEDEEHAASSPILDFEYYVELIDRVLAEDDMDHDGYLSYPEYVIGRMKDADNNAAIKYSSRPIKN